MLKAKMLSLAIAVLVVSSLSPSTIAVENPPVKTGAGGSGNTCRKAPPRDGQKPRTASPKKPNRRADSLRAIMEQLNLGKGSAVADIGAGRGRDSWVFAEIVGKDGLVYAEEIVQASVNSLKKEAKLRELPQLRAVLGRSDDPCLPPESVDLAYMHYVYHHFAKPREMLRGLRRALKPGGYLVIVDRRRGTLRDWAPREAREQKHYWIAETTVVREAREEGFAFVRCAEDCWPGEDQFALVFRRPSKQATAGGDPDRFLPLSLEKLQHLFLPLNCPYERPVFIALGEARKLIKPIMQKSGPGIDVVLEEWATQKDERPPLPSGLCLPSLFTENGDPHLGPEPVDVVFFLDTYHLLFHHQTLLARLRGKLAPTGCVYVLDRKAQRRLSRREASHHRRIRPDMVKQEMAEAGFHLWFEGPSPAADRFLLVFGKTPGKQLRPEQDLFVGGPIIRRPPDAWLAENYWRLRGVKTAEGTRVPFRMPKRHVTAKPVAVQGKNAKTWRIPEQKLELTFEKTKRGHLLRECRSIGEQ